MTVVMFTLDLNDVQGEYLLPAYAYDQYCFTFNTVNSYDSLIIEVTNIIEWLVGWIKCLITMSKYFTIKLTITNNLSHSYMSNK